MEMLVVSSYPEKGTIHSAKTVGVASYTKTLLHAIKNEDPSLSISVFAEQFTSDEIYEEESLHIHRTWERGNLRSLYTLFRTLFKRKEKTILVSFEIYMFGKPIHTLFALLGLMFLRVTGKKILFVMHQVLGNFQSLEAHLMKMWILNRAKGVFYYAVLLASTKVIVFEEQLKQQLAPNNPKIHVIPHFVYAATTHITKKEARNRLGWSPEGLYCVYFGYIAPYKGIDQLVNIWPDKTNVTLIIAGGANPNHKTNKKMQQFVAQVDKAAKKKGMTITGFIPEEQVSLYFIAADCVLLPYTTFMSSSGPLALAFAYEKAVLISPALASYVKTSDVHQALSKSSLSVSDITLPTTPGDLETKLSQLPHSITSLTSFSRIIKQTRSLSHIAQQYLRVIETV